VLSELKDLIQRDPNNAELHSRLGDAYFDIKDFNSAVVSYKKAVKINPSDVDAYNDLALSYHYLNNTMEGLAYVNQGIEKNPGYQRIWLTKGFLMAFGVGSSEEAAAALQKAYDLDPTTPVGQAAKAYLEELKNK
jgi:tetratricopeptide (TPR) repeat protein